MQVELAQVWNTMSH